MPSSSKIQEALEARDALAAALGGAGIQLPAMDVRTPGRTTGGGTPGTPWSTSGSAPPRSRCCWPT